MRYAVDTEVIKPSSDKRLYRVLHLPNGLCAVLVHDPEIFPEGPPPSKDDDREEGEEEEGEDEEFDAEQDEDEDEDEDGESDDYEEVEEDEEETSDGQMRHAKHKSCNGSLPTKKAAAAMCVGMGSFSDPTNAQGLAHFLEHMLFMGSSKFPDENEYDSYLSKHGGSSNAYTETEYTCYHFEVNREYLKGALDRFSQFFISPLVKSEAMDREVLAVDSEFNQVLQSDSCRLAQLQCHTSSPNHPLNGFFWGNKKSLIDAMESGVNMRDEIFRLYRKNYYGGMMKLVVIGGESLDILENWVIGLFGDVREGKKEVNGRSIRKNVLMDAPIWKPGKLHRIEAVRDVHVLDLTWTLPCLHDEYLKKPEDYLAHLLGHEGKGSLLSLLKEKGWASTLSAGVGDDGTHRSSVAYIFVMSIHLTDSGLEKIYDIIGMVYQYIKLLRLSPPQEWIFKELQDIGNMEFRFAEEQPQDEYVASLAENLLFYSEEHIIYGEYAFEVWDDNLVRHILGYFTPKNMRVDVLSKSFNKELPAVQLEPWFGTRYTEEDIPSFLLELWEEPPEIDPALNFPAKNEFIPQDFTLRNSNIPNGLIKEDNPRCILALPSLKLWYKLDSTFNVPRANTYFLISLKEAYSSVKHSVLFELFIKLLRDELNETLYQAGIAKLETSLCVVADKLELKVYGFNDKLPALLHKILFLLGSFVPKEDRFLVIKEDMERAFRNTNIKPLGHSTYLRLQILRETFWDVDDRLSCLVNLYLDDLKDFVPRLLSELYIEGLCHGNLSEEEIVGISDIFMNIFSANPLPLTLRHRERVLCLPSNANLVKSVPAKNKFEVNSVAELYFQIEPDAGSTATRMRALADLFSNIVEEPCFNQLRTKEQLGYTVDCGSRMTYRVLGFCFRVQSSEYNPIHLRERIDCFINGLLELLNELDDESFESHRSGLIEAKLEKDPSLTYETDRYWTEIVDKRYLFDISKREAEELKTIQKKDVVDWYMTYLRPSSPKCRRLSIHVWGCNAKIEDEAAAPVRLWKVVDDISSLKLTSEFYECLLTD